MTRERIQLGPGVPDLRALGVADVGELLDGELARAVEIARDGAGSLVRVPLPGTVGADGRRGESPRGAGTGWLLLRRWRGGAVAELLRARFTPPRSASLAERAWNVACHLRAHGVGTPDLVAVGARGAGLVSKRSFLLLRELDGYESLERWLAEDLSAAARRRGAVSIGSALGKVIACGVALPRLDARSLFLSIEPDAATCLAEDGGPKKNLMPSIVIGALEGARIGASEPLRRAAELLGALDASVRALGSAGGAVASNEMARLRLRVLARAARGAGLAPAQRRRLRERLVLRRAAR
jgi:hypothetical protein